MSSPAILFVCLGNICRSPTAEGVFASKAASRGIAVKIDSAGTAGYHKDAPPDKRSQDAAKGRGYDLSTLKCRKVTLQDFEDFDYIIAMDHSNLRDLERKCPEQHKHKISLLMAYANNEFQEVPDPYYGGKKGFDLVLDLIEDACEGLLDNIERFR